METYSIYRFYESGRKTLIRSGFTEEQAVAWCNDPTTQKKGIWFDGFVKEQLYVQRMSMYKAILFALNGDWVTDCLGQTKEEVWDKVADLGSKWYFYPQVAIIKDYGGCTLSSQRICEVYTEYDSSMEWAKGKSIKTVSRAFETNTFQLRLDSVLQQQRTEMNP